MTDGRRFADTESLRPVVRAALGKDRRPVGVRRLAGGSKKGVYRLTMEAAAWPSTTFSRPSGIRPHDRSFSSDNSADAQVLFC
jgi:hypothetical protein